MHLVGSLIRSRLPTTNVRSSIAQRSEDLNWAAAVAQHLPSRKSQLFELCPSRNLYMSALNFIESRLCLTWYRYNLHDDFEQFLSRIFPDVLFYHHIDSFQRESKLSICQAVSDGDIFQTNTATVYPSRSFGLLVQ